MKDVLNANYIIIQMKNQNVVIFIIVLNQKKENALNVQKTTIQVQIIIAQIQSIVFIQNIVNVLNVKIIITIVYQTKNVQKQKINFTAVKFPLKKDIIVQNAKIIII